MEKVKKKYLFFLMVVFILVLGIILYSKFNKEGRSLQEQLDIGNKYLQEMNYEEAIVAFNIAINIDPRNVEAYMGLADAYIALDNLDDALHILEKGYELTKDEQLSVKIRELISVIEKTGEEEIDQSTEEISQIMEPVAVVMEGRREHPFYEQSYKEEEEDVLNRLIQALQNDDRNGIMNCGLYNLPRKSEGMVEGIGGVFKNYAVAIYWGEDNGYRTISGDIYALTDGEFGYSFYMGGFNNTDLNNDINGRIYKIPCKNGSYHGEFSGSNRMSTFNCTELYSGTINSGVIVSAVVYAKIENLIHYGSGNMETIVRETTMVQITDGLIQELSYGGGTRSDEPNIYYWEVTPTPEQCIGKEAYISQGYIREIQVENNSGGEENNENIEVDLSTTYNTEQGEVEERESSEDTKIFEVKKSPVEDAQLVSSYETWGAAAKTYRVEEYSNGIWLSKVVEGWEGCESKYWIMRTDFSDGLLDEDGNGIDDRDPYNSCGYTDLNHNAMADGAPSKSDYTPEEEHTPFWSCDHGVVNGTYICQKSECEEFREFMRNARIE